MAKRRPSGDGMVRKRDDGRWEGRIVVGHKENVESIFRYVENHIRPSLGDKHLARLAPKSGQWYGVPPSTLHSTVR